MMTSSVIACVCRRSAKASPGARTRRRARRLAHDLAVAIDALAVEGGSISLRWRMCSSPSSSSSECGPSVGRRISFASPAFVRRGPAVKTVRTSAGSPSMTQGIGSMRAVKTSPKRARWRAAYVFGPHSHSPSAQLPVRGPGGSPDAFMNASVHSCAMPAPATATASRSAPSTRAITTARRPATTPNGHRLWRGRPPSGAGQGRQGAGARRPLRALARRSAPAPATSASTCSRPGSWRRRVHRHLPRDARRAAGQRAAPGARRRHRRVRRRGAAVRGRLLRPRLRPRRAAPPARPRPRLRRVPPRAAARRAALLRRRAVALRRPHRPGPQARGVPRGAAVAAAHARRARAPRATATAARPTTSSRPSSTSTPSPPTSSRRSPRARAGRRPHPRRGAAGQLVRVGQPRAGGDRRPRHGPVGLEGLRLQGLPGLPGGRPPAARAAPAAGDLLQPHPVGAEGG